MNHIVTRALLAASATLSCGVAWAQETPVSVITDTWEYCSQLEARIAQRPNHPGEVRRLELEGRRMCDHGDVRGGIARLRQALVLLKHPQEAP
jgi:hypothetical protein